MNPLKITISIAALAAATALIGLLSFFVAAPLEHRSDGVFGEISPDFEAFMRERIGEVEDLASSHVIVAAAEGGNRDNAALTNDDIIEEDRRWRETEGLDDFSAEFLTNDAALRLVDFQIRHPGYSEIILTDAGGLNLAMTGKTSDYFQADEAWWTEAYLDGSGRSYYGPFEFDESVGSRGTSVFVPVRHQETGAAIGVLKAFYEASAIIAELHTVRGEE